MRTDGKLTENEVDADGIAKSVREAIYRHGGNRKEWYAAVSKKIPDFPAWRTLYEYTRISGRREKRIYDALMAGLSLSPEDLTKTDIVIAPQKELVLAENDLYSAINGIIDRVEAAGKCKEIRLCAMHGTDHSRVIKEPEPPEAWNGFVNRMARCIDRSDWRVEVLYNVPSKERLDQICGRIREAAHSENHEVRAFGIEGSLQLLCPMIIGDADGFLGLSHPRYYRTGSSLYIQGRDKVTFVRRYWNLLWDHARVIRSEAGEITSEIERLEQELNLRGKRRDDWLMGDMAQAIDAVKRIGG